MMRLGKGAVTLIARGPCPGCDAPEFPVGRNASDASGFIVGPHGIPECPISYAPLKIERGVSVKLQVLCPSCLQTTTLDSGPPVPDGERRMVLVPHGCASDGEAVEFSEAAPI